MSVIGKTIGKVVGGITGASDQAKAAQQASAVQANQAQQGIDEQRRQFDSIVELMRPFVTAGQGALDRQGNLLGLRGTEAQQQAIENLKTMPQYQALVSEGEEAILQNASATGGLRGGNIQKSLAEFRPNVLSQLIESQFNKLGSITQLGQASAGLQAGAGQTTASNVGNLLNQQGAAIAGGVLAKGNQNAQAFSDLIGLGTGIVKGGGIRNIAKGIF